MKNLYEGGNGCAAQCDILLRYFALILLRVSSGVAVGPMEMPRYSPFVCEVSMVSQELELRSCSSNLHKENVELNQRVTRKPGQATDCRGARKPLIQE